MLQVDPAEIDLFVARVRRDWMNKKDTCLQQPGARAEALVGHDRFMNPTRKFKANSYEFPDSNQDSEQVHLLVQLPDLDGVAITVDDGPEADEGEGTPYLRYEEAQEPAAGQQGRILAITRQLGILFAWIQALLSAA